MTTPRTGTPPETGRRRVEAPRVFYPALTVILLAVVLAIVFPDRTASVLTTLQSGVVAGFGPYLVVLVFAFVLFTLAMGLSRFGDIKLARDDDEEPEFGLRSWFAMLFAAGMGIGLVF